ncbi:sigma-70 family RNA polymerase sigma factor, partial [Actinoplanes sp. NPDC051633]|uniref:RNA polymerase sigma factor n=1 Tax=Actinoplanes sp. NPDC051633 TaxID=3155670 RepID=UPI00342A9E07
MDVVEQAYRDHWARLLALLVTRLRRFDVAEDSLQDAFVAAARSWPADGVPANPAAWLMTAAHRRALDRLRRETRDRDRLPLLITDDRPGEPDLDEITDERLRMLFACCHPALAPEGRAAMMLRFVGGLTTAEIARLFLVSESTMAARLTRAKRKMALAGIPLREPSAADLPERIDVLLKVVYLLFTEGYRATEGSSLVRDRLASEAIRLGYVLGELLPGEERIIALLALMILQHSRRDARIDGEGALVLLPDQDRDRWHHDEIAQALDLLHFVRTPNEYALQAWIAAEHATAAAPDWPKIARLYADLEILTPSPIVRLNRAVAVAEAGSPEAAWALLQGLDSELPANHLLSATRG